ncbi:MAG: MGMT family protein [Microgenomates group bacterium]|jgi:methylated-DNA-protein-cysteine methyltransferase-like protein
MGEPPLNFRQRVISIVKKIPKGKVTTYGTIAVMSSHPRGARIVGGVLHFNSEKYDLPWHRVVNCEGYISIKSMEHPKGLQKALLEQEGVEVSDDFIVNLKKYGWIPLR